MSKFAARILASAVAFSAVATVASSASAAVLTLDIIADGTGITVVSTPANDLATATSATTATWLVGQTEVSSPLSGTVTSFSLSNPVEVAPSGLVGNTLTVVIGGKTYTDDVTEMSNPFDKVVFTGELMGPGLGSNTSVLDLSYTQAGGTGRLISVSGTYTVSSTVPESGTWAMMLIGFVGLGYAALRRSAKGGARAVAI